MSVLLVDTSECSEYYSLGEASEDEVLDDGALHRDAKFRRASLRRLQHELEIKSSIFKSRRMSILLGARTPAVVAVRRSLHASYLRSL